MSLQITDELIEQAHMTEQEFKIELAVWLFSQEKFTLGQASAYAGISQFEFQRELGSRKIPVHYDIQDFREDMKNIGMFNA